MLARLLRCRTKTNKFNALRKIVALYGQGLVPGFFAARITPNNAEYR
jgi:hypothetical protein